jgi:hypothetical protein
MKNPGRDIPRVVHTAVPIVISCNISFLCLIVVSFVIANIGYFAVLPVSVVINSKTLALVLQMQSNLTTGLWSRDRRTRGRSTVRYLRRILRFQFCQCCDLHRRKTHPRRRRTSRSPVRFRRPPREISNPDASLFTSWHSNISDDYSGDIPRINHVLGDCRVELAFRGLSSHHYLIADNRSGGFGFATEGAGFRKVYHSTVLELTIKTISSTIHCARDIL